MKDFLGPQGWKGLLLDLHVDARYLVRPGVDLHEDVEVRADRRVHRNITVARAIDQRERNVCRHRGSAEQRRHHRNHFPSHAVSPFAVGCVLYCCLAVLAVGDWER